MSFDTDLLNKAFDKIEAKQEQNAVQQREIADRLLTLEQKSGRQSFLGEGQSHSKSYGQMAFDELHKNADLLAKTRSLRLELKAAGDPLTTTSGRTVFSSGVGAPLGRAVGLQNGLPSRTVAATSASEYSRYTGMQGFAAQQLAEGDAKAAVRPDHTLIMQSALTIAGYCKMSRQAMNDRAELKRAVDVTLMRSVNIALDVALVNGATGFAGGFEGLATAYTSPVYQKMPDAISEGVATMQVAGFEPNMVALNPADWLAACVARGTANDHYLSGSYLGALPLEMRGLRVVLSASIDAGKALLFDTSHVELLVIDGFAVEVAYSGDDFTKNLVTVLGETRVIPIFLTVGAARYITPKA